MRKLNVILSMIVITQFSIAKAEEKTYEHQITSVKETSFGGQRLEEEKAAGHSGFGYQFIIDGQVATISADNMEEILKFRGYKSAKQFMAAPLKNSIKDPVHALHYEYLMSLNKGRYTPPSDEQFYEKLAKQISTSTDSCPNSKEIVDGENSYKMASRLMNSSEDSDKFIEKLGSQLHKNGSGMSLIKTKCDSQLASKGQGWCYRLSKGNHQVSRFAVGPYEGFGFTCISNRVAPSTSSAPSNPIESEAK